MRQEGINEIISGDLLDRLDVEAQKWIFEADEKDEVTVRRRQILEHGLLAYESIRKLRHGGDPSFWERDIPAVHKAQLIRVRQAIKVFSALIGPRAKI